MYLHWTLNSSSSEKTKNKTKEFQEHRLITCLFYSESLT